MSEREYIFTCILNELYKQTEYYNYLLPDFLSLSLPDFPWILHKQIINYAGTSVYFWAFPSKASGHRKRRAEGLREQLATVS